MAVDTIAPETVQGVVESVNPKGIKVAGQWFNYSRFAPDVPRPAPGQCVELVAKNGFISQLALLPEPHRTPPAPPTTPDRTALRLAVLKAAAHFASTRPEAKSNDVLRVAER